MSKTYSAGRGAGNYSDRAGPKFEIIDNLENSPRISLLHWPAKVKFISKHIFLMKYNGR